MNDTWMVPGGPIVDDAGGRLRLVPPESWRRVILVLPRLPPSMNNNAVRSHWHGFQKEKKSWQAEISMMLLVDGVPKGAYQRAIAGAVLRFPTGGRVRDTGNFTRIIDKALGDALVIAPDVPRARRYIPDDDELHFFFVGVEFAAERGPPESRLHIYLQPKE